MITLSDTTRQSKLALAIMTSGLGIMDNVVVLEQSSPGIKRKTLQIFISSPSDVRPERLIAERVAKRLGREFAYHFSVEARLWEREPLVATHTFQEKITPPRETDIVVVILWSRLGAPLPADKFRGAVTGNVVTGTEWEFEDAWHASTSSKNHLPNLLLYRKTAKITVSYMDEAVVHEGLKQKRMVDEFLTRWTRSKDGKTFAAAWWEFEETATFEELLETHLRALIHRRLQEAGDNEVNRPVFHGRPFRGLLSFEPEHAPIFFGRTHVTSQLRELLARQADKGVAFVLVMGASGSGKSSLVKAGLLPDLMLPGMVGKVALCRWSVLRPSDAAGDPVAGLAAAMLMPSALPELAALNYTVAELAEQLRANPAQVVFAVRQGLTQAGKMAGLTNNAEARLTVVVDQLEELFTLQNTAAADRDAFVAALDALARSGLVWAVATMRSDFFDRLETLPALADLSAGEARYLLVPPNSAEIAQIIHQPAREAGLRFEVDMTRGISLDEVLREAASRDPGALPLLSFLLDQLWQQRNETQTLTFAAYEALGGLEGALGRRAEEVFQNQPAEAQAELPAVLRALVTVGADGKATSRWASLSFADSPPRRNLIDAFLHAEARLLVAAGDAFEGARVRVAHEALLTHWTRARDQIAADTRDLELRGRLEQAAEHWRTAAPKDKASLALPAGRPLAEATGLMRRWKAELPAEVVAYIEQSRRGARNRRVRLSLALAGAGAALPLIAGFIWVALVWWGVRQVEATLEMVAIPGGCFTMGSPDSEVGRFSDEGPQHRVCIEKFKLAKYAVTQEQWRRVMIFNSDPSDHKGANQPVENVSWYDAQMFIRLMSIFGRHRYRLPSEAEREYATRAGTQTARFWSDRAEDGCSYANAADLTFHKSFPDYPWVNCDDGYLYTAPVDAYKPNGFGLYGMLGNVWEWVEDCFVDYAELAPTDGSIVTSKNCAKRGLRGGSWWSSPGNVRSAQRGRNSPDVRSNLVGFRLAETPQDGHDPPRIETRAPIPFSLSPPSGDVETGSGTK
jgi:formylglycine-generating enzyme required for sulfatase activity